MIDTAVHPQARLETWLDRIIAAGVLVFLLLLPFH